MKRNDRHIRRSKGQLTALTLLAILNIICVVVLLLCAYSGKLHPAEHPRLSALPLLLPYPLAATLLFLPLWLIWRKKLALISLAGLLLSAESIRGYCPVNLQRHVPAGSFRLLSYNVGNVLPNQQDSLVEYLLWSGADIICFQEYKSFMKIEKDPRIADLYPYTDNNGLEGRNTCLSRFPILRSELITFEQSQNSAAAYHLLVNGDTLMLVNTHLQSYCFGHKELAEYKDITEKDTPMSDREKNTKDVVGKVIKGNVKRSEQADYLAAYLDSCMLPATVVCGDFNETANGYAHHVLTRRLNDAYTRTGNGLGLSYTRNGIHYRIDHVLVSEDVEPINAWVDNTTHLSDHFPIYATLKVR